MADLAKVGIISIGDMGVGIAKVLIAKGFTVFTTCKGRSQDTIDRATEAKVTILKSDLDLVETCDVILSVVPPKDAVATAQRIIDNLSVVSRKTPLYFADMNAVSPATSKSIASTFEKSPGIHVKFIDGCILGGPPKVEAEYKASEAPKKSGGVTLMPTSGPHDLSSFPGLADALKSRHISPDIGSASGLKMCFGAMHKGLAAIAVQSYTTAHALGVLPELQRSLIEVSGEPGRAAYMERMATGVAPKAYRWAGEMEEIAATFSEEGGFEGELFKGAAGVFKMMADDTVLGKEKVGKRVRGTTGEDVAAAITEGLTAKRKKMD